MKKPIETVGNIAKCPECRREITLPPPQRARWYVPVYACPICREHISLPESAAAGGEDSDQSDLDAIAADGDYKLEAAGGEGENHAD